MSQRGRALFHIHILHAIERVPEINLADAIGGNIIALGLVGGRIVMILKQLGAVGDEDFLKATHQIVRISEVVARDAAQASQPAAVVLVVTTGAICSLLARKLTAFSFNMNVQDEDATSFSLQFIRFSQSLVK